MSEGDAASIVERFWTLIQAREWDGVAELLHEDFECEWPHSGERIRGRENFMELNRHFPEPWSVELKRVVGEGDRAVSEIEAVSDGTKEFAVSFFEIRDGRLARVREFWIEERGQDPPAWRAQWVEPL